MEKAYTATTVNAIAATLNACEARPHEPSAARVPTTATTNGPAKASNTAKNDQSEKRLLMSAHDRCEAAGVVWSMVARAASSPSGPVRCCCGARNDRRGTGLVTYPVRLAVLP